MTSWQLGPLGQDWVEAYASASGDDNPMHRGQNAIVHGALLLALMEQFVIEIAADRQVEQLEARFIKPVAVGSQIVFTLGASRSLEAGREQIRITGKDGADALCLLGDAILASA